MNRLLMAIALACVLSGTTLAGDMPAVSSVSAPSGSQSSAVVTVWLAIIDLMV